MSIAYKKVLITGGAGFVGSSLAIKLKEKYPQLHVMVLDNLKRRGSELILQRISSYGITFRHGDIRNKEDLEGLDCDLLIECSAEAACVAGLNGDLSYLINTNLLGAINCLDLAAALQADFLFLSSSRIYPFDKINGLDFKETATRFELVSQQNITGVSSKGVREDFSLEGTRTFYGASKLAVEHFIHEYQRFKGLRAVINRCGLITGPWQMGRVDQGVVVFWLAAHMFGRPLKYLGWEGRQVRDFIHIDDLFRAIELQIHNFDKYNGEVFNLGGGLDFSFSLIELTQECEKIIGKTTSLSYDRTLRPGDIRWFITDASKAGRILNWAPQKKLTKTLKDIADWIGENQAVLKNIL